jgi:hypothetical protein
MVYLNRRNIIKFEWDFGKPSNSNDATLAGDNLLVVLTQRRANRANTTDPLTTPTRELKSLPVFTQ